MAIIDEFGGIDEKIEGLVRALNAKGIKINGIHNKACKKVLLVTIYFLLLFFINLFAYNWNKGANKLETEVSKLI